jgi:hypothetical protein
MKETLRELVELYDVVDIVDALADICLDQAKRLRRAEQEAQSAMWKCNHAELFMTVGSLYNTRVKA